MSSKTIFPRASSNRVFLVACYLTLVYFIVMDFRLNFRIHNYAVRPVIEDTESKYSSMIPCDLDPLCTVTVKGLLLDYPNYYLLGPLTALVDRAIGISDWLWISPSAISIAHVFVAIASAKCISTKSLTRRRLGVMLFELRSWLDDLDGLVARKRHNVSGEHSEIGTSGFYVDGICDALGTIALLIGVFQYLKSHLPKYGYEKLRPILPSADGKNAGACIVYRKTVRVQNVAWSVLLIAGSLLVSSFTWNRYLYLYQDLLETNYPRGLVPTLEDLLTRQNNVFRFNSFWLISILWRLTNPHALTDYLLISIFFDRVWDYVDNARWISYGAITVLAYFTEFHYHQALMYVTAAGASLVYSDDNAPPMIIPNGTLNS